MCSGLVGGQHEVGDPADGAQGEETVHTGLVGAGLRLVGDVAYCFYTVDAMRDLHRFI